jgi:hypothetical protein
MANLTEEGRERLRRLMLAAAAAAELCCVTATLPPPPEAWSDWRVGPVRRGAMADLAVRMTDLRRQLTELLAGKVHGIDLDAVEAEIRAAANAFVL